MVLPRSSTQKYLFTLMVNLQRRVGVSITGVYYNAISTN
jgi:hypothetical protein